MALPNPEQFHKALRALKNCPRHRPGLHRTDVFLQAEELYREVDEELQREKLLSLWRRYGKLAIAIIVIALLAVGGYFGWRYYQQRQARAAAFAYAAAQETLQKGDAKQAGQDFAGLASGSGGYAALASLRLAQVRLGADDTNGAITILDQLADNGSADPIFRAVAALSSVSLQIDAGDPATLRARLQKLIDAGGPWRFNAREMQALLDIRTGNLKAAEESFDALSSDADAPQDLQSRAAELRDALSAKLKAEPSTNPTPPATE
ncbi:hypothetical protein SAMN07250955_10452 [Arboricoccus pini]|uniref:Ancillary SecYEG translocon subunit/Cell division coordinator CpoB TPR domain-containing protein n=1 Tax=Arboricoccus pini TaxID=1963835 RepID=A0A212QX80_9PROT|nr:tetratricopeptide repeat protein [Arboricoccus pini]SNB64221.1 hypothetical protein SAMN07250955_10452 [Arboricoccus pini]